MLSNPTITRKVTQGNTIVIVDDLGPNGKITFKADDVITGVVTSAGFSFNQTPTAPTPTAGNNSTLIATTAFVQNALAGLSGGGTGTANSLTTPRQIALSGDVTGSTMFDGSANVTISATLPNVVTGGTFAKVTVNNKGLVTAGLSLTDTDITTALGYTPLNPSAAVATNTTGSVVRRDSSGNFAAGIIYADVVGNASSATKLATSRTINGVGFDGTANITISDNTRLPLTGGILTGNLSIQTATSPGFTLRDTNAAVDARQWAVFLDDSNNALSIAAQTDAGGGASTILITRGGELQVLTNVKVNGHDVYHQGNLFMSNYATKDSPVFTGAPTAPTPTTGDNSFKIATTQFVQTAIAGLSSGGGGTPVDLTPYAKLAAAQTFKGRQTVTIDDAAYPIATRTVGLMSRRGSVLMQKARGSLDTPAAIQNTDIIGGIAVGGFNSSLWSDGTDGGGELQLVARENWTPTVGSSKWRFTNAALGDTWPVETLAFDTDNLTWKGQAVYHAGNLDLSPYAPKTSPVFSGTPQAPNPATDDRSTRIATTEFVRSAISTYSSGGGENDPTHLTVSSTIDGGSY